MHSTNRQGACYMSLSPVKQEMLETMLLCEKPMKAMEIAQEINKELQPIRGHLLGLIRVGYVSVPEKGQYVITQKGKQALGIPETTKEKAEAILAYAPHDKAFSFYVAVDKPLSLHAHTLRDFANKLEKADVASLEFHTQRGDFEAWFKGLGDEELAKKTALLRQKKVVGEDLRKQLRQIVEQRYLTLAMLAGQPVPLE
jgi:hypothetical protein